MTESGSKLHIVERQVDGVTVLTLSGVMTSDDGDLALGSRIDDLVQRGHVKIVANLADVSYIDSSGVGRMVAELQRLRKQGGALKLAHVTGRSHHLLTILKMVFEIFDDETTAVKSFSQG